MEVNVEKAVELLKKGGVIAYPTEAVFGFGCDPLNQTSLQRILEIKSREPSKGLILVAGELSQLLPFIDVDKVPATVWAELDKLWPGPFTFIMPCSPLVPELLSGGRPTIAVRVSAHKTVRQLCALAGIAIVSTSCNRSGLEPLRTVAEVEQEFGAIVDGVVKGQVGANLNPTEIRDALTGKVIRKGDPKMDKYAVLGNPVEHSRSPFIHTQFAHHTAQNLTYGRILCPIDGFKETVDKFRQDGGLGLNVTVPFKGQALRYADVATKRAQRAGAANTLRFGRDGVVWADNTDGAGIVWDFKRLNWPLKAARILILGAGGAARGIVGPIVDEKPESILIVNRTEAKAQEIAKAFAQSDVLVEAMSYEALNASAQTFDLIINSTSCSLHGEIPGVCASIISSCSYAYDLMYSENNTAFINEAKALGVKNVADGLGMLVGQAALSFEFWRGVHLDATEVLVELRKMV